MIFMFANVWLFDDMFNSYELQEKQNIEYLSLIHISEPTRPY